MKIHKKSGATLNGVSCFCPKCQAILSASLDPASLKADIVSEVERVVMKWR
jgi:hypothetical protein